jgi:hypothetical protein
MARRTVYIPDDIDDRVTDELEYGDSYSAKVQAALREFYGMSEVEA